MTRACLSRIANFDYGSLERYEFLIHCLPNARMFRKSFVSFSPVASHLLKISFSFAKASIFIYIFEHFEWKKLTSSIFGRLPYFCRKKLILENALNEWVITRNIFCLLQYVINSVMMSRNNYNYRITFLPHFIVETYLSIWAQRCRSSEIASLLIIPRLYKYLS